MSITRGREHLTAHRPASLERARRREAMALALPSALPIVILSVLPIVVGILYAFTDSTIATPNVPHFVGLANFKDAFDDAPFWHSFGIGAIWTVSVTVLQVLLGLALALLLNSNLRFTGFVRVLAIIPWAMPPVVVAIMWQAVYSPTHGPLNWLVGALGGPDDTNWLGSFSLALPAVIAVGVWVGIPQNTVAMLAGLQQVPDELIDAAKVDGAGSWGRFVHVTLPALRPVMFAIGTLSLIWTFNSFGIVYVMTAGGPGGQTLLPMLFIYNEAFHDGNTGMAAAMTDIILVLVIVVFAVTTLARLRRSRAES